MTKWKGVAASIAPFAAALLVGSEASAACISTATRYLADGGSTCIVTDPAYTLSTGSANNAAVHVISGSTLTFQGSANVTAVGPRHGVAVGYLASSPASHLDVAGDLTVNAGNAQNIRALILVGDGASAKISGNLTATRTGANTGGAALDVGVGTSLSVGGNALLTSFGGGVNGLRSGGTTSIAGNLEVRTSGAGVLSVWQNAPAQTRIEGQLTVNASGAGATGLYIGGGQLSSAGLTRIDADGVGLNQLAGAVVLGGGAPSLTSGLTTLDVASTATVVSKTSDAVRIGGIDDARAQVTGTLDAARYGILSSVDAGKTFSLDALSGANISGDVAAIVDGDANALVNVFAGASVSGDILLGGGSDALNMYQYNPAQVLDGGDDVSAADGMIDTLTLSGLTVGVTGGNVRNWENVVVDGGVVSFTDHALTTGSDAGTGLTVQNSGVLDVAGGLALTGNLVNSAVVTSQDGIAGDQLAVSGSYTGGGRYEIDTVLGNDGSATDIMVVAGDTAGTTTLVVTNVGGTGAQTDKGILVVDVQGSSDGTFVLEGETITAGDYTYELAQVDGDWYLQSTAKPVPAPDIYEAVPATIAAGFAKLPTLEQRVGQRQWWGRDSDEKGVLAPQEGAWIRVWGDWLDLRPERSASNVRGDLNSWGLQAGYDKPLEPGDNGQWVVGGTLQYGEVSFGGTTAMGTGEIKAHGFGLGATATWYGNNGLYFDGQGQINWVTADVSTGADGDLVEGADMKAYALSGELGYRHAINENAAIVPQAQLTWSRVSGGNVTDALGNRVDLGSNTRLTGRLGVAYEYEYSEGWLFGDRSQSAHDSHREKFYAIANILHDFKNESEVRVNGVALAQEDTRTWGEVGFGGSIVWDENKTLYTETSYRKAFGGSDSDGLHVTAGFRMQF